MRSSSVVSGSYWWPYSHSSKGRLCTAAVIIGGQWVLLWAVFSFIKADYAVIFSGKWVLLGAVFSFIRADYAVIISGQWVLLGVVV